MAVGDLNFGGAALRPADKNPPLLIDATAPKPFEIAGKCFAPVGRWHTEFVNRQAAKELAQLHQGALLQVARKPPGEFPSPVWLTAFERPWGMRLGGYDILPGGNRVRVGGAAGGKAFLTCCFAVLT